MPRNNSKPSFGQLASIAFDVPVYLSLILPKRRDHHPVLQLLAEENEVRLVQICSPNPFGAFHRIQQRPCAIHYRSSWRQDRMPIRLTPGHRFCIGVGHSPARLGFQQLIVRD